MCAKKEEKKMDQWKLNALSTEPCHEKTCGVKWDLGLKTGEVGDRTSDPRSAEKTCLRGLRQDKTQTGLLSYID